MTPDELEQTWAIFGETNDPALLEILFIQYEPLARYLARRAKAKAPAHQDADDILSYAHHGLLDALSKFDPNRGIKFETYASRRIAGSITDGQRREDPLSRPQRKRVKALAAAELAIQDAQNRPATVQELAEALDTDEQEIRRLRVSRQTLNRSMDQVREGGSDGSELPEFQVVEDGVTALQIEEMRDGLSQMLPRLSERDRTFIVLHYCDQLSLRDIGLLFGVSDARCGQIRKEVIRALSLA